MLLRTHALADAPFHRRMLSHMHAFAYARFPRQEASLVHRYDSMGKSLGSVVIFCKTLFLISSKSTANLSQKTVGYPSRKGVHYIFFGYHRLYLIIAQNFEKYIMHPFFGGIPNSFLGQISCTFGWNQKEGFTKDSHGPPRISPLYIWPKSAPKTSVLLDLGLFLKN